MQLNSKVVGRTLDGRVIKGFTLDFAPDKEKFHVVAAGDDKKVTEVQVSDLKALFYVKSFTGDAKRPTRAPKSRNELTGVAGTKMKITFNDGEVLFATTNGYSPGRMGYFVLPVEKTSNNVRVFVVASAVQAVESWR
jgi:hypothetical protein